MTPTERQLIHQFLTNLLHRENGKEVPGNCCDGAIRLWPSDALNVYFISACTSQTTARLRTSQSKPKPSRSRSLR